MEPLFESLQKHARDHGYGVYRSQAGNKTSEGTPRYYTIKCTRDKLRPSQAKVHKKASYSKKIGCTWRGRMTYTDRDGGWTFHLHKTDNTHTHEGMQNAAGDHVHRRLSEDHKRHIEGLYSSGVRTSTIVTSLESTFPDILVTSRDVHNHISKIRMQKLQGFTSTQAFAKAIDDHGLEYAIEYEEADPDRLKYAFWSYPECQELLLNFNKVLSFDCTYKTNRYEMPLMNITGVTNRGTTFNVGFAILPDETQESYDWIMTLFAELLGVWNCPLPEVIISDFQKQFKQAALEQLPDSQQILCIFHINKNVCHQIAKKWQHDSDSEDDNGEARQESTANPRNARNDDVNAGSGNTANKSDSHELRELNSHARRSETFQNFTTIPDNITPNRKGILTLWAYMVYTESETVFNEAWNRLQAIFSSIQQDAVAYLRMEYLPIKEQWAGCYTSRYRKYGQRTTSPTESNNHGIKMHLETRGKTDLFKLWESLKRMIEKQFADFNKGLQMESVKFRQHHLAIRWAGDIPRTCTRLAFNLMLKQYYEACRFLPTQANPIPQRPPPCTCTIWDQYGLFCYHKILKRLEISDENPEVRGISYEEIDPWWRLSESVIEARMKASIPKYTYYKS